MVCGESGAVASKSEKAFGLNMKKPAIAPIMINNIAQKIAKVVILSKTNIPSKKSSSPVLNHQLSYSIILYEFPIN